MDLLDHNRKAWTGEVAKGNTWTIPVSSQEIANARNGKWSMLLTPTKPVPQDWYPDINGKKVLCLASGGGQQGPIFAAAGAEVTVIDNCPAQLAQDKLVSDRENLTIKLEQGDMRDLSRFEDESFDLVFHPVSNCFVDNVIPVWKESYRVLKKDGILLSGFINPITYIFDMNEWDKNGKLVIRHSIPYSDLQDLEKNELEQKIKKEDPIEFGHSLQDLIGGQIAAGFVISGFYEDNAGGDLLDPYINTFIATKAVKL
jgi:ubiquinone/menaquinone biosynthesis C-methylase UbiE